MAGLRLLAVHAHQDDESITMGGLLAVCSDRGVRSAVVCCTDGKLATIVAADMPEETTRPRLAEIRQAELRAACSILGVSEVHFLGYGDSGMAGEPTNALPDAFWRADLNEVVGKLVARIRSFRPQVVVTYDGVGNYGHPDHIQTHRATLLAVEAAPHASLYPEAGPPWRVDKLYYTAIPRRVIVRGIEMARARGEEPPFGVDDPDELPFLTPDEWLTTVVDIRTAVLRKREALRAHRSQIDEGWPMLRMPEELALGEFGDEHLVRVICRVESPLPETDVFAGVTPD